METAPATSTTSAAPAAGATSGGSSEMTTAGAASQTQPAVTVSTGAPGTSSAAQPSTDTGKWFDKYDADTKDYLTQKGFQDPKAVVDSYRNLEKLRGVPQERLLKLPEAGDEKGMSEIFEKLGKPATPEGYGFAAKDPNNTAFTDWAKGAFHKLNLTSQQGQELVKQFNEYNQAKEQESAGAHTAKVQEQVGVLKKEWGAAYNQNVARAQAAYRQFGIPDAAIDSLEKSIGFDGVIKLFNSLGSKVGEHTFVGGDGVPSFGEGAILTPEQANARIRALKQDGDFSARYIKGEVKARQEMDRLMKMANPT